MEEGQVIKLTEDQYKILQEGLQFYYDYLSQPNEMAIDYAKKRKMVYDVLEHVQSYAGTVITKKLVNGEWQVMHE